MQSITLKASLKWIQIFSVMVLVDFFWALYVSDVASGNGFTAGLYAAGLFVTSGFVTTEYVRNRWLLIPAGLGAFAGTLLGVLFK